MNSRTSFLSDLNGQRSSIADFILYCKRGELTEGDRMIMLERARVLAEAGEMYGYRDIANAARILKRSMQADVSATELVHLAQTLYDACHQALIVLPPTRLVRPPVSVRRFFSHDEKPRLLTADDDRSVRSIVKDLFEKYAHIIEAENGIEALHAIRLYRPDVVILDDTMPDINGLTIIDTLHTDPELRDICVFMLTSTDGEREINRAFNAGAVDYITKPFDPMVLAEKVMATLSRIKKSA